MEKTKELIIALLARLVWKGETLREKITKGKRNPPAYVHGYNACNGKNTVTEIARIIGVSQPNMTTILKDWEKQELVYNVGTDSRPLYKRLMYLEGE